MSALAELMPAEKRGSGNCGAPTEVGRIRAEDKKGSTGHMQGYMNQY